MAAGGGGEACREQQANQKGAEPCVTLREEGKKQKLKTGCIPLLPLPEAFHWHCLYYFVSAVERKVVITLWNICAEPLPAAPPPSPGVAASFTTPGVAAPFHKVQFLAPPVGMTEECSSTERTQLPES